MRQTRQTKEIGMTRKRLLIGIALRGISWRVGVSNRYRC